ncbi:bifunctional aldolase/short-chain dehydrogenase [Ruania alkalisoli]|nr:bifunctional aldolase/short-chain dehydrogenase [Ruania alkalisoli]
MTIHDAALDACVRVSRTLGSDPSLVLHGGGNTSVKSTRTDVTGESVEVVLTKGSGYDLASIVPEGFTPLRKDRVLALAELAELDDVSLVNELKQASMDASAPSASIEAILHALIPHRFVLHTHADAIVTLTNQTDGERLTAETFGEDVWVLPYVKPGFALARQVAVALADVDVRALRGIVLRNHGLFTFADDADEALATHLELVRTAAAALPQIPDGVPSPDVDPLALAGLRKEISEAAGAPMVLQRRTGTAVDALLGRADLGEITQRGPLTPEHVIHTKRVPMMGTDVAAYVAGYQAYVDEHRGLVGGELTPIDPAPRVILDETLGFLTAGRTVKAANVAADIYEHTAAGILRAEAMTGFRTLLPAEAFDIEYWVLEQRKLRAKGDPPPFAGEVALVTGAASGIGRACAQALREAGAAVIALDRDAAVTEANAPDWYGIVCDVSDADAVRAAVAEGVGHFGGLDILVPAAGVFAASHPIDGFPAGPWATSLDVNVTGLLTLLGAAHPYLALAPRQGRVVLVGSKNVPAPGQGAAAYSASKAAATQLARVAALEWAPDGIRVNTVNPDAVFDTALWSPELLEQRAAKYGMSVADYKRRNLLRAEITSADVGDLVAAMCGPLFAATTGAQVPIDGGSDRIV